MLAAFTLLIVAGRSGAAEIDFAHDVVPILREHCGKCHLGDKKQGGFSMNTREALLAGGENGKAVVVGKSGESDLIDRLTSDDPNLRMPPEGPPVPPQKVAVLKGWIDSGLKWEAGFAFNKAAYEPQLLPRIPELPAPVNGRDNPVDRIVDHYFEQHNIPIPERVSDAAFLRRVSLDLVGLLPEPDQLDAFLSDQQPDKRRRLVRALLGVEKAGSQAQPAEAVAHRVDSNIAYAEHWLTFWNDLLRNDYTGTGFITGGRKQITSWLYRSLLENKPYDQFVRELIAPTAESEGYIQGIRWRGNVSASQSQEVQFAQSISQSFLGINMKCASCHDSFIDNWKLENAYGLAAIYATQPLDVYRCDKPTGAKASPAWIFPELGRVDPDAAQPERLRQLAVLMTHPGNGRFTRTIVNRIWHRLMGRGIVHPVDAMHTAPWSADLLDYLAVHLAENRYDLKATMELICTSEAYQAKMPAAGEPQEGAGFIFRGPAVRRLSAEQFLDAIWQLTRAGPARPDAQVVRGNPAGPETAALTPEGKWVWSVADTHAVPAGEAVTMRRKFELKALPTRAIAAITCDNSWTLYVNGQNVRSDDQWETVEVVPLETRLRPGANTVVIVAKNGGATPNPAGLYFEARIRLEGGSDVVIGTDATWEWTASAPDGRGEFKEEPKDWQPAVPVTNAAIWDGQVGGQIKSALVLSSGATPMVRASLMKSDTLMRSLGRPNRDQIVTMRPADLTTLEAIALANGEILAGTLSRGAAQLLKTQQGSPENLANWIYKFALARPPTSAELAIVRDALGAKPDEQAVEDLLWALLMQPEFQLVR